MPVGNRRKVTEVLANSGLSMGVLRSDSEIAAPLEVDDSGNVLFSTDFSAITVLLNSIISLLSASFVVGITVNLADDAYYDLPVGSIGFGTVIFGDQAELGQFTVQADGTPTIVHSLDANLVTTDTDGKYCIFDNGTYARIRNRSGGALDMRLNYFYG